MSKFNCLKDLLRLDIKGKRVLLRADLNVPMKAGKVADSTRIKAVVPTITELVDKKAKVVIISHFGRPKGKYNSDLSLSSLVDYIQDELLQYSGRVIETKFGVDSTGASAKSAIESLEDGQVLILENLRFHEGEESNDGSFADELASYGDYYINDSFSASHRAHASITGVAERLPSFAGLLLEKEVECLSKSLHDPERPMCAIVGGSKVSTKIDLLNSLIEKADYLLIGGGMANTFLYAQGINVGKSLCEKDLKDKALNILEAAEKTNCKIMLPIDTAIAENIESGKNSKIVDVNSVPDDQMILDIGTQTVIEWSKVFSECKTLIWNGPVGAIEFAPFENGSIALARTVAYLSDSEKLNSVAGGGDTINLICMSGLYDSFSYISTAGGAFLEWLEGKKLPGIKALIDSAKSSKKVA